MKFQPTWKHTMYNLKGALKVIVPLSIVELIVAMLNAHETDKALTRAYTLGQEDGVEQTKENPGVEVKAV